MKQPVDYITTWFYKESKDEASFYPQLGQKGSSSLVQAHSCHAGKQGYQQRGI